MPLSGLASYYSGGARGYGRRRRRVRGSGASSYSNFVRQNVNAMTAATPQARMAQVARLWRGSRGAVAVVPVVRRRRRMLR